MNELMYNALNLLMILTFTTAAICFLLDNHVDDLLHVKEPCRFGWAFVMLVCLYTLYLVALGKASNERQRYDENKITGITIKL
jgi:Ca2+/Na+ antiporter